MYVFVIYNCITIPFQIAFLNNAEDEGLELPAAGVLNSLDLVIDIHFWIDMLITFRTTFYDSDNELVTDQKVIAALYARGWFPLDLCATFPWEALAPSVYWMSFLKALRLVRISRLLKKLDAMKSANAFRMAKTLSLVVLLAHWIACLWWLLGTSSMNMKSNIGSSWLWRHRSDKLCTVLANTTENWARTETALEGLLLEESGSHLSEAQLELLRHNWRYAWCDGGRDLQQDFKLFLGNIESVDSRIAMSHSAELILQQATAYSP